MTESEILEEITLVTTAIKNIMVTGQNYEIGTGSSKRVYAYADLDKLRSYRRELQRDLANLENPGGGYMVGF